MPATTSTAFPSLSHDQHYKTLYNSIIKKSLPPADYTACALSACSDRSGHAWKLTRLNRIGKILRSIRLSKAPGLESNVLYHGELACVGLWLTRNVSN